MIRTAIFYAVAVSAIAALTSSTVAQANPATSMVTIEASAAQMCAQIDDNPTSDGVFDALSGLSDNGFDAMDAQLTVTVAMHHGCPQHEVLIMDSMTPIAEGEICSGRA